MNEDYKILYAEDEPSLREIYSEILRDEGFKCTSVENGHEATKLLEKEHFDLLITDFRMPVMDGASLLFWCRERNLHLPVIFVSGNIDKLPFEKKALEDCCSGLLNKPINVDSLLNAIDAARKRAHDFDCNGKAYGSDHPPGHFMGEHYH